MTRSRAPADEPVTSTLAVLKPRPPVKQASPPPRAPAGGGGGGGGGGRRERGYECQTCHRRYSARKNLVRHLTLECGREPQYKCPYCSYSKHRRNELKKHLEKKHPRAAPLAPTP